MNIFKNIKKVFTGGKWFVAIKPKNQETYKIIKTDKGVWLADPFLYKKNGKTFLFVEYYIEKEKKASLAYYEIVNNDAIFGAVIIKEPYHLSYPCIFEHNDKLYIIPESSAGNVLSLYECITFPDYWVKKCDIMTDTKVVDTTVYIDENNIVHLLAYNKQGDGYTLDHYIMGDDFRVSLKNNVFYEKNIGRPAGKLFSKNGSLLRPAQECSKKYGESIIFYNICSFDPYEEKEKWRLCASDLKLPIKAQRIHTYCENDNYNIIDCFVEKFDLFHALKIYKRSHFVKMRKQD